MTITRTSARKRRITTKGSPAKGSPSKDGAAKARPKSKVSDWQTMTVADVMQPDVVTVMEDLPMPDVERVLAENRISGVPVTDERGLVIGVLSLRDIVEHYTEEPAERPPTAGFYGFEAGELEEEDLSLEIPLESTETAGALMTKEVLSVRPEASLREAAKEMVRHGVHRLLVTQRGRTAGIVSTTDLLRAAAQ
jgi:CBS domain-containing protein